MVVKKDRLIVIPAPGFGHLGSIVEMTALMLTHNELLSVTVLVIKSPFDNKEEELLKKLSNSHSDMSFVDIPLADSPPVYVSGQPGMFLISYIDSHKDNVARVAKNLVSKNDRVFFMVDFFSNSMIKVANEFEAPCFSYVISGAGFVGLAHYITTRLEATENEKEWHVPSFATPVPTSVLPSFAQSDVEYATFSDNFKYFTQMKGIIVNTFYEMESFALRSFLEIPRFPKVYAVGPLLEVNHALQTNDAARARIMTWLDEQERESVVFLCFGRGGCFSNEQVNEIALGLERSGVKFLWSLRKPISPGTFTLLTDMDDPSEILPTGYLSRIEGRGMVCGWAPQQEILAQPAIGGFVTHCGINSVHESIRFGVPMATWPLYADHQLYAFTLVKDLKIAVEITMDYRIHQEKIIPSATIQNAIEYLMDINGRSKEIRKRVKELSEISKTVADEGGSSFEARKRLMFDMLA